MVSSVLLSGLLCFGLPLMAMEGPPAPPPAPASAPAATPGGDASALKKKVDEIFDESCTMCHSGGGDPTDPGDVDLTNLQALIAKKSAATDAILIVPGNASESYLLKKMIGAPGIVGDPMPPGDPPLPKEQLQAVTDWINALPPDAGGAAAGGEGTTDAPAKQRTSKPFRGTEQISLPTTTALGKRTIQYRIDHRFGRIGTERGAFGLDAGVVMSFALAFGILDGWDVRLRRTNQYKGWELSTKYIPIRQEDGWPVSYGAYVSLDYFRDFDVQNRWSGNFMLMLSRLWFDRWSTMVTLGYHLNTNKNPNPTVDLPNDPIAGAVPVRDKRDTLDVGVATSVWLGKKKRWGLDLEWVIPVPDGGRPNVFHYRGGDADPGGTKIGAWSLGAHYYTGKHFFQVFFTNNRQIHPNLVAPGGQTANPFTTPGVDSKNPFLKFNFFIGFNLSRLFTF